MVQIISIIVLSINGFRVGFFRVQAYFKLHKKITIDMWNKTYPDLSLSNIFSAFTINNSILNYIIVKARKYPIKYLSNILNRCSIILFSIHKSREYFPQCSYPNHLISALD